MGCTGSSRVVPLQHVDRNESGKCCDPDRLQRPISENVVILVDVAIQVDEVAQFTTVNVSDHSGRDSRKASSAADYSSSRVVADLHATSSHSGDLVPGLLAPNPSSPIHPAICPASFGVSSRSSGVHEAHEPSSTQHFPKGAHDSSVTMIDSTVSHSNAARDVFPTKPTSRPLTSGQPPSRPPHNRNPTLTFKIQKSKNSERRVSSCVEEGDNFLSPPELSSVPNLQHIILKPETNPSIVYNTYSPPPTLPSLSMPLDAESAPGGIEGPTTSWMYGSFAPNPYANVEPEGYQEAEAHIALVARIQTWLSKVDSSEISTKCPS